MKIDRKTLTVRLSEKESEKSPFGDQALEKAEAAARQMSRANNGAEARVLLFDGGQISSVKAAPAHN